MWILVLSGLQQPGFVPWASGGEGRGGRKEERESPDSRLAQLDAWFCRNVCLFSSLFESHYVNRMQNRYGHGSSPWRMYEATFISLQPSSLDQALVVPGNRRRYCQSGPSAKPAAKAGHLRREWRRWDVGTRRPQQDVLLHRRAPAGRARRHHPGQHSQRSHALRYELCIIDDDTRPQKYGFSHHCSTLFFHF